VWILELKMANSKWGGLATIRKVMQFLRNTSGNMTITFGLASIPLLLAIGAAVDASRIGREDSSFHAAVDSACLAVAADNRAGAASGSITEANRKALETMAAAYIKTNYSPSRGYEGEPSVSIQVNGQDITTDASLDFPTTIMQLGGVNSIRLNAHCKVALAMKPIEVAMVMDTTGSMDMPSSKMTASKAAARKFLEVVYGGTETAKPRSEYVRIAFVPFSASVRLDPNAFDYDQNWLDFSGQSTLSKLHFKDPVTGTNIDQSGTAWHNAMAWGKMKTNATTALQWDGCIETRMSGTTTGTDYNINDTAPDQSQPETLFPYYFAADTSKLSSGTNYNDYATGIAAGSGVTTPQTETYKFPAAPTSAYSQSSAAGRTARYQNMNKYTGAIIGAPYADSKGPWQNCVRTPIVPMTYDRGKIETAITAMTADGNTVLPEGLAWGLRVLSPTQPFTKVEGSGIIPATTIAPYNGPRWQKIMLFMTDGENALVSYNGAGTVQAGEQGTPYSAYGWGNQTPLTVNRFGSATTSTADALTKLDTFTTAACTKIKNAGIALYVVGFEVPSSAVALLKDCATKPTAPFYQDATTANISTLFDNIGQDVLNKMVYIKE
jgi:Flp pilus assembly protein TadG